MACAKRHTRLAGLQEGTTKAYRLLVALAAVVQDAYRPHHVNKEPSKRGGDAVPSPALKLACINPHRNGLLDVQGTSVVWSRLVDPSTGLVRTMKDFNFTLLGLPACPRVLGLRGLEGLPAAAESPAALPATTANQVWLVCAAAGELQIVGVRVRARAAGELQIVAGETIRAIVAGETIRAPRGGGLRGAALRLALLAGKGDAALQLIHLPRCRRVLHHQHTLLTPTSTRCPLEASQLARK